MFHLIQNFPDAETALSSIETSLSDAVPAIVLAGARHFATILGALRYAGVQALTLTDPKQLSYALANLTTARASVVVVAPAAHPALQSAIASRAERDSPADPNSRTRDNRQSPVTLHPYVRTGALATPERLAIAELRFREHHPKIHGDTVTAKEIAEALAALDLQAPSPMEASLARVRWRQSQKPREC